MSRTTRTRKLLTAAAAALAVASIGLGRLSAQAPEEGYPHGEFREDCRLCHLSDAWSPARIDSDFDHSRYGWPLEGAHDGVTCLLCHLTLEFRQTTGSACADCHQDVHLGEFGVDCHRCHSTRSFVNRSDEVRAHRTTRFPLTGSHLTLDCIACHTPVGSGFATFANTPTECGDCHAGDFRAATDPDHVAAGFPMDCASCHTTFTWGGSDFDHALTGFPLTGAHVTTDCAQCHEDLQFTGTPSDCWSCHQADLASVTVPDHSGFTTDCAACHSTVSWQDAVFDHGLTAFPLTGAHVEASCLQCHGNGQYAGLPSDCWSCHQTDYEGAADPPHAGFATDCTRCHSTVSWSGATFDHSQTGFTLTGAHLTTSCLQCHTGGQWAGTPSACYSCHQSEYDGTTSPDHLSAGFGTDCASCHSTNGWLGATFDHDRFFPLRGPHDVSCTQCHTVPGDYRAFDCLGCHEHSQTRMDDKHSEVNGYSYDSQACLSCHGN